MLLIQGKMLCGVSFLFKKNIYPFLHDEWISNMKEFLTSVYQNTLLMLLLRNEAFIIISVHLFPHCSHLFLNYLDCKIFGTVTWVSLLDCRQIQ